MKIKKWLQLNTSSLSGKTIAITGSTGGLGTHLCYYLAYLGANLILLDRNEQKSNLNRKKLISEFPNVKIKCINFDAEDIFSVKQACENLQSKQIDFLILNAGAYKIKRKKSSLGLENVFQINFASPYFLTKQLLPVLSKQNGCVIAVSSIAHNYSKANFKDIDFCNSTSCEKIYGNSKRFLTAALFELFKETDDISLSVTHPGISFTNITAHYPKWLFALIKYPMKFIFPHPRKACLSILFGVFNSTPQNFWIGPKFFNVWGLPKKQKLNTISQAESKQIFIVAEEIYSKMIKKAP